MATSESINSEEIPVLFCSNRNYLQHMAVAIYSMLVNSPAHNRFRIFSVVTDEASEERRQIQEMLRQFPNASIEFKGFDRELLKDFRIDDHISVDTYVRLFLPDFLDPSIEKLIYLDCDLLVCSDISALWKIDLGDKVIGAVRDPFIHHHIAFGFREDEPVFNAGVQVIDVKKWRSLDLTPALISYIREHKAILRFHDQDAINGVLRGQFFSLPYQWNFTPRHADADPRVLGASRREFMAIRNQPAIIHFTGIKPWNAGAEPHYKDLYYRYRSLSSWHDSATGGALKAASPKRTTKTRAISRIKWHFPRFVNFIRRWAGVGDPVLQAKFLAGRSISG